MARSICFQGFFLYGKSLWILFQTIHRRRKTGGQGGGGGGGGGGGQAPQ